MTADQLNIANELKSVSRTSALVTALSIIVRRLDERGALNKSDVAGDLAEWLKQHEGQPHMGDHMQVLDALTSALNDAV